MDVERQPAGRRDGLLSRTGRRMSLEHRRKLGGYAVERFRAQRQLHRPRAHELSPEVLWTPRVREQGDDQGRPPGGRRGRMCMWRACSPARRVRHLESRQQRRHGHLPDQIRCLRRPALGREGRRLRSRLGAQPGGGRCRQDLSRRERSPAPPPSALPISSAAAGSTASS